MTAHAETTAQDRAPLTIDVWADIVCPWCYVGMSALNQAIAQEGLAGEAQVRLHSFELDPQAPTSSRADGSDLPTNAEYLARTHGVSEENFRAGEEQLAARARTMDKPYTAVRPTGNTRALHRLTQTIAGTLGADTAARFFEELQNGYFAGELNIFDDAVLRSHAVTAGLPEDTARQVLEDPTSDVAVRAEATVAHDIESAQQIGVPGVPFMVFLEKFAAPGAQTVETYRDVLRRFAGERAAGAGENA